MWAQKITQQREAKLNSPAVSMYTSDISAFVFMVVVLHSSTRLMHLMPQVWTGIAGPQPIPSAHVPLILTF